MSTNLNVKLVRRNITLILSTVSHDNTGHIGFPWMCALTNTDSRVKGITSRNRHKKYSNFITRLFTNAREWLEVKETNNVHGLIEKMSSKRQSYQKVNSVGHKAGLKKATD